MTSEKLISGKQDAFIRKLAEDRELDEELKSRLLATIDDASTPVKMKQASGMIKWLLSQPRKAPEGSEAGAAVPAGRYAIVENGETLCFRVDRPEQGKWAGWVFVRQSPGGLVRHERRDEVLAAIAADVLGAAELYGRSIGQCGVCGKRLRQPKSIARGIGPVCAAKLTRAAR
jgi:hypothetical protein